MNKDNCKSKYHLPPAAWSISYGNLRGQVIPLRGIPKGESCWSQMEIIMDAKERRLNFKSKWTLPYFICLFGVFSFVWLVGLCLCFGYFWVLLLLLGVFFWGGGFGYAEFVSFLLCLLVFFGICLVCWWNFFDELDCCGKDHVGSKNYQLAEDCTSGENTLNILEINFFPPIFP